MGLNLRKVIRGAAKVFPAAAAGFAQGGFVGATLGGLQAGIGGPQNGAIGAGVPSIQAVTGVAPFMRLEPQVQTEGGVFPTAGAGPATVAVLGMSRLVVNAIVRLASALGIALTLRSVPRVGMRLWRTVMAMARRHPGISVIAFLASLGLAAEEIAEFLFWGQTKARRRRGRGISARDIRICRRTMRRMASFQRDVFRAAPKRRALGRGAAGTVIAQN